MMTTMYHSARGHYFHEPRGMYSTNMNVKQEMFEDSAELPVDMTLTRHQSHGVRPGSDLIDQERPSYYDHYMLGIPVQAQTANSGINDKAHAVPISPSPQSSDFEGFQLKGSDGKLAVPAILTKSCRAAAFRKIDLLASSLHQRAKREFVPDEKKDEGYWSKRLKNNDSARRSRVKRKALEKLMESRLLELQKENIELKHEMAALKKRFGLEDTSDDKSSGKLQTISRSRVFPSSSSLDDILDKEDELDLQSTGSEDSRSNDDSRVYSMGSVNSLNQSLGLQERFGVSSATSRSVSSTGSLMSRSDSRSSHVSVAEHVARQDQTGALDLTSESGSHSSSSRDSSSPEWCSKGDRNWDVSSSNNKSFPLKCRWKKEMHSAACVAEPR
ncbi:hypothetical protein BgiMline_013053 [Biomphalaria glabrata]|nr:nuclear factor interleukin 3 regulated-like protein [Biomphalaria glabrata]